MMGKIARLFKREEDSKKTESGGRPMKEKVEEIKQMVTDLAVKTQNTGPLASELKNELNKVAEASEGVKSDIESLLSKVDNLASLTSSAARESEIEIREKLGSIKWRV